jgi:hypothetical protein
VLIDDPVARRFLERAQYLGGVMAGELAVLDRSTDGAAVLGDQTGGTTAPGDQTAGAAAPGGQTGDRLGDALRQLQEAAAPLLQRLHPAMRDSIQGIGRTAEE